VTCCIFKISKKTYFQALAKLILKKIFFSKKVKLAFFFTKTVFSQKLDFRGKQTNYRQIVFETEKYRTFPTKQREPSYI
jgi:hypothetical protein